MAEPESVGQPDAVLLAPLTEDTFLHNLHVRYKHDIIYTYVGNALVSVNPCRPLPLYSAELVRAYLARPPYQLPPHLYAITATAYRWVRDRNESQCIVITGESGAGKTEAARVCLQCAAVAGGDGGAGPALTAAGTLLEAFGNAATALNHNASRFGKLLEIEFDFKGEPVGGHMTHYLLEKERVCGGVLEGERNFHVLYQLLAGADVHLLKRLRLQRSWEHYRMLRGAGAGGARGACGAAAGSSPRRAPAALAHAAPRAAAQDRDHFAFTTAAMRALGFGGGECDAVLRLLAFMLKLGNVEFEPQHNIDGSIGTRLQHQYELVEACALVGVDADELAAALGAQAPDLDAPLDAESSEGSSETGACSSPESAGECWAGALRDQLVCVLYSRLFTWLINNVNAALRPRTPGKRCAIGILDVYGFESLARNGLERLLINYAAERVQAAVTGATLRREQEEYAREGLPWRPLHYAEHELHADLLDAGPDSVLGVLRDCSARGLGDAAFLQRLQRRRHPRLLVLPPDHFQVVHFGGAVVYDARGIVAKNRDAVCRRCCGVLGAAREPLLAALFAGAPDPRAGSPRRPAALACRQRALVGALVRRLPAAPRLVRCLRADADQRPARFDAALLRHQIRSQGIMDMALLRRSGWCESMCARAALARYGLLRAQPAPAPAPASPRDDPVRAARALLRALPIPSAEFAYGRTRVFVRSPRTVWELEALRAARVEALVVVAQLARARGARGVARVVRVGAAPLPAAAVAAAAGAAHVAGVRRVAGGGRGAAAGPHGRAAAAPAPRVALPAVPRRLRPDRAQPHAREGDGQRAVQGAQAELRAQRGAPVRGRLRAAARVGGLAARAGRGRRPLRGVRGRGGQGGALHGPRGALPVRGVNGRAAAAGGALAAPQAPRAGARRVAPVAVALRRRPARRARARVRRSGEFYRGAVAVLIARHGRRARLPVRGRGRVAAARRRGGAHVPRAGAGHQAVPRGAERGGRAAARQHRHRVRGQLRAAAGDAGLPRRARRGRGRHAPAAPRQPHGRARVAPRQPHGRARVAPRQPHGRARVAPRQPHGRARVAPRQPHGRARVAPRQPHGRARVAPRQPHGRARVAPEMPPN